MLKRAQKNKRGARGSLDDEEGQDAKRSNMAESADEPTELSSTEIKVMFKAIQNTMAEILQENQNLKEEFKELKAQIRGQDRKIQEIKDSLKQVTNENLAIRRELQATKSKLQSEVEETERLADELDHLEQYTRKSSLEIHGVPEDGYESTEEVVIKLGALLGVDITPQDIEISHKLKRRNKPIIVKFSSYKTKSKLYKKRVELKNCVASDLIPNLRGDSRNNRLFLNENLTVHRREILKKANNMRKDRLIQSAWTLDGKIFVKTSPEGRPVSISCEEDLDNL